MISRICDLLTEVATTRAGIETSKTFAPPQWSTANVFSIENTPGHPAQPRFVPPKHTYKKRPERTR